MPDTSSSSEPETTTAPRRVPVVRHRILAGLIAAALVTAVLWLLPDPPPARFGFVADDTTEVPIPGTEPTAAPEASDGGELRIVEQGYTVTEDLAEEPQVSWAVIIENTSAEMAGSGQVHMTAKDSSGDSLSEDSEWDAWLSTPALPPGGRTGLGSTSFVDSADIESVDITVDQAGWIPADSVTGGLTAGEVECEWVGAGERDNYWTDDGIDFPVNERGHLHAEFRIDSSAAEPLTDVVASALYRDSDGDLVGASRPDDFEPDGGVPPGWSVRALEDSYGPNIDDVDTDAIEVYVYSPVTPVL